MKHCFFIVYNLIIALNSIGQIGINTSNPHPSAALDISSTTKGLLPPKMTKAERDAIVFPAEGLIITCTDCTVKGLHQYINGSWQSFVLSSTGNYGTVVNPVTGKVWLDRNLGATQVATSSTDAASYGDLYQWGRSPDGHEKRSSMTTFNIATNWYATQSIWNGFFIRPNNSTANWLSTPEAHMWSVAGSENNPCPSGFRIPTHAEWNQERLTWASNNAAGAFASPLKLPLGGNRSEIGGHIEGLNTYGNYWSSTANNDYSVFLSISASESYLSNLYRATGLSVRCIQK